MTIDQEMIDFSNYLIENFGKGHTFSKADAVDYIYKRHGRKVTCVLPSDYCYNRVNNGIDVRKKPALFEYIVKDTYICWGANYSIDRIIYHKPKGTKDDIAVGECKNGIRDLYNNKFYK